jgi:hypothetical protein
LRRSNFGQINWGLVFVLGVNTVVWTSLLVFAWRAIGWR